jgi:hypothetical protein
MNARVETYSGITNPTDASTYLQRRCSRSCTPDRVPGCNGEHDERAGVLGLISLWDDTAALDASDHTAAGSRDALVRAVGTDATVEVFTDVVSEIGDPPPAGCRCHSSTSDSIPPTSREHRLHRVEHPANDRRRSRIPSRSQFHRRGCAARTQGHHRVRPRRSQCLRDRLREETSRRRDSRHFLHRQRTPAGAPRRPALICGTPLASGYADSTHSE